MILILIIFLILFSMAVGAIVVLARRLLQFDESFQVIFSILAQYQLDLKKMSSGDLLLDNPEILEFQQRNLKAIKDLESTISSMSEFVMKTQAVGPRPDVE